MPVFLFILLAFPFVELAVLVSIGAKIGVLATIALVILTGACGTILLKMQGASAFSRLQVELQAGRMPDKALADAAMIVLAGIFLILPGFISDVIGLALFLPPVRSMVIRLMARHVTVIRPQAWRRRDGVVDLDESEYRRSEGDPKTSPWRLPGER